MKIVSQCREQAKSVYNRCRFDVKKEILVKPLLTWRTSADVLQLRHYPSYWLRPKSGQRQPEMEEWHNIVVDVRPM
jgi:hypothetical protein